MSHGLVELGFKVHRGLVAERAVEPRAVVKDFDPFKDRGASLGTRGEVRVESGESSIIRKFFALSLRWQTKE